MEAEELNQRINAALQRLDPADALESKAEFGVPAEPGFRLTCGHCGNEGGVFDDPIVSIYTCDECGGRIAYGTTLPRVTIDPTLGTNPKFIHLRLDFPNRDSIDVPLDIECAAQLAIELLSVSGETGFKCK